MSEIEEVIRVELTDLVFDSVVRQLTERAVDARTAVDETLPREIAYSLASYEGSEDDRDVVPPRLSLKATDKTLADLQRLADMLFESPRSDRFLPAIKIRHAVRSMRNTLREVTE